MSYGGCVEERELLLAVSSDLMFENSHAGCTLLPVSFLGLSQVNRLNIPQCSLTQTNRPSPLLPFPFVARQACEDTQNCFVSRLGGQKGWRVQCKQRQKKVSTQVIIPNSVKKCKPTYSRNTEIWDMRLERVCALEKTNQDPLVFCFDNWETI